MSLFRFSLIHAATLKEVAQLLTRLGMNHHSISVDATPHSSQASTSNVNDSPMFINDVTLDSLELQFDPPAKRAKTSNEDSVMEKVSKDSENDFNNTSENPPPTCPEVQMVVKKSCNICPECGDRVDNRNISRHIKENHSKNERFPCEHCGKTFQRKGYLENHICKSDIETCPFQCGECGQRFPSESKLKSHIKYKSKTCPQFCCLHCEES